jgi:hypothetical protein
VGRNVLGSLSAKLINVEVILHVFIASLYYFNCVYRYISNVRIVYDLKLARGWDILYLIAKSIHLLSDQYPMLYITSEYVNITGYETIEATQFICLWNGSHEIANQKINTWLPKTA